VFVFLKSSGGTREKERERESLGSIQLLVRASGSIIKARGGKKIIGGGEGILCIDASRILSLSFSSVAASRSTWTMEILQIRFDPLPSRSSLSIRGHAIIENLPESEPSDIDDRVIVELLRNERRGKEETELAGLAAGYCHGFCNSISMLNPFPALILILTAALHARKGEKRVKRRVINPSDLKSSSEPRLETPKKRELSLSLSFSPE